MEALEVDPEQDFIGILFQLLELSSHWHGQFFTPYSVCRMMANMQMGNMSDEVKEKGFVSVNDPACGAGALLIAIANAARSQGVDYQNHILFVAQDIDRTAALMCYIQLSLLGCSGYIVVADTLRHPVVTAETEVWCTPMYFSKVWHWRRTFKTLDRMLSRESAPRDSETPGTRVQDPVANRIPDEPSEDKELVQLVLC
ncbi:MAG: N-6 DNA methylase [Paenibacillaceae bacterium]